MCFVSQFLDAIFLAGCNRDDLFCCVLEGDIQLPTEACASRDFISTPIGGLWQVIALRDVVFPEINLPNQAGLLFGGQVGIPRSQREASNQFARETRNVIRGGDEQGPIL